MRESLEGSELTVVNCSKVGVVGVSSGSMVVDEKLIDCVEC